MDVLTEIMALFRTQGHLYGRLELTAPFGLQFPGKKGICLIVTRGSCLLGVDEQALVPLVGSRASPRCRARRSPRGFASSSGRRRSIT
ncbi:cupin domain-containing protein [Sorangium sp. So ce394]|uniref:cupin domain-containing protein n=1 Tax=Sorangium sp. So ce394 TaxID=3133310 RepID=UPI003F5C3EAA